MNMRLNYKVWVLIALTFLALGYFFASRILMRTVTPAKEAQHIATVVKPMAPLTPDVEDITKQINEQRLMEHIEKLADRIGVRQSGTAAEEEAARYIADSLRSWGYQVRVQRVDVEGRTVTQNVIATRSKQADKAMLIGAHIDSKIPSPGANDNASGVAVMLELAYLLGDTDLPEPCVFVGFGAEEMVDKNSDHHHYGSRALASDEAFRAGISCMTTLDMVGVGQTLYLETRGSNTEWRDSMVKIAKLQGYPIQVGAGKPWSDHEAFEKFSIPTAYIHWEKDTNYHKKTDTADRINPKLLIKTTKLMLLAILKKAGNSKINGK